MRDIEKTLRQHLLQQGDELRKLRKVSKFLVTRLDPNWLSPEDVALISKAPGKWLSNYLKTSHGVKVMTPSSDKGGKNKTVEIKFCECGCSLASHNGTRNCIECNCNKFAEEKKK